MAIITISRQIASLGDEVAAALAEMLGYSFINRKLLEEDLLRHGITEAKLKKYDEKKPGFWASLARDRDEYFDYLREAVYERAQSGNSIFIGRGGFAILKDIPGCYAIRLVAPEATRVSRLMKEFSWDEKKAQALVQESDENRRGFHKCFFNIDHDDPSSYDLVLNTNLLTPKIAAQIIKSACSMAFDSDQEAEGLVQIKRLLTAQKIVNHIVFDLKIPVYFLEATSEKESIMLHGVANSPSTIDRIIDVAKAMAPGIKITSGISIVQDYKSYP